MDTAVYVWLALAFIFLMIEIFSPGFIFACFVVGSLGGALTALFSDAYLLQGVVFAVVSLILIPVTRPLANRITRPSPIISNVDGLIGKTGYVKAAVTDTAGQITVDEQVWQARSVKPIAINKKVIVLSVQGAKLKVQEIEQ